MTAVFNDEFKRLIAGRANTLLERLDDPDAFEHGHRDESEVTEVFDEWRDLFPSEEAFDRRLDREGLTRDDCREAISADRLAADEPLPEWIDRLDELVATVLDGSPAEFESDTERMFPELSDAIATYARDQLPHEVVGDVLSEEAVGEMAEWFRLRFEDRFTRILFVEFKSFVAAHDRDLAFADPDDFEDPPTEYYDQFVEYLFSSGFADFCQEYPVFARLIVDQIRQWNEHLEEFCRRLRDDEELLAERFDVDGSLGNVTELEPLADDTHGDGRAVMRVTFESGLTVAYKPRSVEAGATFYRVLDDLNDHLSVPDFRTPAYLSRDGYGWMEWVEYAECDDADAVERYYQRAGALTCIAYFLEFADCQYENLIVAGEHPVLVDAETVLHPYVGPDQQPMQSGIGALKDDSALLSLLCPFGIDSVYPDGEMSEMTATIAGFSDSSEETVFDEITHPAIEAVTTDVMSVEHEPGRIDRSENIPKIDGTDQPPEEYLDEIIEGFETAYETVIQLRDDGGLADVGLPDAFESIENRIVYRATVQYMSVINALSARPRLRDGARFGIGLERLTVPFCDGRVSEPKPWSLYDAEQRALKRLDPPRFTCRTNETEIRIDGSKIGVNAAASGIQRSRDRIASASRADMREQVEFIRGCFGESPDPSWESSIEVPADSAPIGSDELQREATELFERVRDAALETEDGTYHWASVAPRAETELLTLRPADGSLYAGRCGIGLLAGALYSVTGEDQYRTFALDAVDPVREAVRSGRESPALANHGGTIGIGSVAYGLATLGDLLDDRTLLEDATRTTEFVTEESLEDDETYDVSGGAAGTILGLLGAHDRTDAPELASAAAECGDYLLDARVTTDDGFRVWETLGDCPPPTGFAHGAGGIAYALARLAEATGESAYREAALEAVEYESRTFSESEQNWPDLRPWSGEFADQWCHGRSGIGLARIGMSEYVDDDLVTRGIDRALDGFVDRPGRFDHLCCGDAGRVELLLEADERLGRRPVDARELLGDVVARKRQRGSYRTSGAADRIANPTLFHGDTGIAYTMLRAMDSELPNVLLWE